MSIFYTSKFYDRDFARTSKSAGAIVPFLLEGLGAGGANPPQSVIDVGCGRGVWLNAFKDHGVPQIAGRDGPWTRLDRLLIDTACFAPVDLGALLAETQRFDLAMTLEVAEHIDAPRADQFVENLVALSDTILFSAAIAGQGGQYHVNEQPLSCWQAKFAARGYRLFDVIRPRFWQDGDVCWWYRQNIVVFCNDRSPYGAALEAMRRASPDIVDLAHPIGFSEKARLANLFSPEEYLGVWAARLKQKLLG
jgi:Methyltransferase domain